MYTSQVEHSLRVLLGETAQTLELTASVSHSPAALPPAGGIVLRSGVQVEAEVASCDVTTGGGSKSPEH